MSMLTIHFLLRHQSLPEKMYLIFKLLKIYELLKKIFHFLPAKYVWSDPKPISNQCNNQSKVESILRNELEATEKFWYLDFPYFCYKLFPKDTTWPDRHWDFLHYAWLVTDRIQWHHIKHLRDKSKNYIFNRSSNTRSSIISILSVFRNSWNCFVSMTKKNYFKIVQFHEIIVFTYLFISLLPITKMLFIIIWSGTSLASIWCEVVIFFKGIFLTYNVFDRHVIT